MATIQEQLENAVAIYNKCASKVNKFINGSETETIESDSGAKPTLAKIVKDSKDAIAQSMSTITEKSEQVTQDKNIINQLKQETENLRNEVADIFKKFGDNIGSYQFFSTENIPDGWLRCDGTEISKDLYPDLVKYLNNGDETALIANLPNAITVDGRGRFLRDLGVDGVALTTQEDEIRSHRHNRYNGSHANRDYHDYSSAYGNNGGWLSQEHPDEYTGGEETRPVSLFGVLCIKAYHGIINEGSISLHGIPIDLQNNKLRLDNLEPVVNVINKQTVLWESPTGQAGGNYVLSESMNNFKRLIIESKLSNNQRMHDTIYPNLLWINGHFYAGRITGSYTEFKCLNETTFNRVGGTGSYNMRIIGVK